MLMIRNSTLFSLLLLMFLSCGTSTPEGVVLKGKIDAAEDMQLFFDEMVMNKTQVIAKAPIGSDGSFEVVLKESPDPGIYRIRVGSQRAIIFLDGKEKEIVIRTHLDKISDYDFSLEGAPAANELVANVKKIRDRQIDAEGIKVLINEAKDPILAMHYAAALPPDPGNLSVMQKVGSRLSSSYPESQYAIMYNEQIANIEKQIARSQAQELIKVGQPAPDISLPNESVEGQDPFVNAAIQYFFGN